MMKVTILKVLNPVLAILLLNQVLSAMLRDFLPHEAFEVLHEGGGLLLTLGVLTHLALNWNWVKANYFKRRAA